MWKQVEKHINFKTNDLEYKAEITVQQKISLQGRSKYWSRWQIIRISCPHLDTNQEITNAYHKGSSHLTCVSTKTTCLNRWYAGLIVFTCAWIQATMMSQWAANTQAVTMGKGMCTVPSSRRCTVRAVLTPSGACKRRCYMWLRGQRKDFRRVCAVSVLSCWFMRLWWWCQVKGEVVVVLLVG